MTLIIKYSILKLINALGLILIKNTILQFLFFFEGFLQFAAN